MEEEAVVGKDVLKAVGSESRIAILKALRERQKTQSELASELGLSAPTVLEHMQQLDAAGLIEQVPEYADRKWKYYRLTKLGQGMVGGRRMSVVVMLCYASAVVFGCIIVLYLAFPILVPPPPQPSVGSCGAGPGSACITNAMTSLCPTSRTFISFLSMLLFVSGLFLLIISGIFRKHQVSLPIHERSLSLVGKAFIALGLLGILAYILVPPLLSALMGGSFPVSC